MFTSPAYPFPENSSTLGGYSSSISFSLERKVFSNSPDHYFFFHQKGAIIGGKAIIRGRRLFQILLTRSRSLNILFYYPIK